MRRPELIARQSGAPRGWLGRLIARIMAVETAAANAVALDLLRLRDTDRVLEIGFGHGRTVQRLSERVPRGFVGGVDHSEAMLRMARRRCAALVGHGRVALHCADSACLPFENGSFDKVLAVHTLYFWQPMAPHLSEIRRVLVPGGRLVLAFRPAGAPATTDFPSAVYTFRTVDEVADLLTQAGFTGIETIAHSPELVLTAAHVPQSSLSGR